MNTRKLQIARRNWRFLQLTTLMSRLSVRALEVGEPLAPDAKPVQSEQRAVLWALFLAHLGGSLKRLDRALDRLDIEIAMFRYAVEEAEYAN